MLWLAGLAHEHLGTAQPPSAVVLEGPLLGAHFPLSLILPPPGLKTFLSSLYSPQTHTCCHLHSPQDAWPRTHTAE